jgi:hypothetical protein
MPGLGQDPPRQPAHAPVRGDRSRGHAGRVGELEGDALAIPAGGKTPALDHRHLVRHVGG